MSPKYALIEHERRFLVRPDSAPDLTGWPVRRIDDLYLPNSRLRLRRVAGDHGLQFKLCKKYEGGDAVSGPIVNIYLSEAEHAALSRLGGRPIAKRRYTVQCAGRGFGLDVFEGPLAGLMLCEAEAADRASIDALDIPPWCDREVTHDPAFTGGWLSMTTADDLSALLA